jgi:predicted TIM-barrel fold metal-dependent hydrolase
LGIVADGVKHRPLTHMIDTHQHLLLPETFRYSWTETFAPLQGRFGLDDYQKAAEGCRISGTVFMEVDVAEDQSGDEARYFCEQTGNPESGIIGVVASARPEQEGFLNYLDSIAHPSLKGIRRVLHVVPDEVSQSATFRHNIAALAERNLSFDLCLRADQLSLISPLLNCCPDTRFILDHCGQPPLSGAPEAMVRWRSDLVELSRSPNLSVKLSGLVTCLPDQADPVTSLQPVVNHLLECFGPARILWGSDWPVCNLSSDLRAWCALTGQLLASLTDEERGGILSENARHFYRLAA